MRQTLLSPSRSFKTNCPSRMIRDRQDKKWKEGFQRHPDLLLPSSARRGNVRFPTSLRFKGAPLPQSHPVPAIRPPSGKGTGVLRSGGSCGSLRWGLALGLKVSELLLPRAGNTSATSRGKTREVFWTGSSPSVSATVSPRLPPASSQRR